MMSSRELLFEINKLNVIFTVDKLAPNTVLNDVKYTFYKNHLYLILGGNGVGKTTFVKSILGQLENTEMFLKYIRCCNESINAKEFVKKVKIGYIPQYPKESLIDSFSIGENFVFRNKLRETDTIQSWLNTFVYTKNEEEKIKKFINNYDFLKFLEDRLDEPVSNLSGGEQQLLNLAIVLYYEPDLIIMDEPTSKLDVEHKEEFWQRLIELHIRNDNHVTYIITTHDKGLIDFKGVDRYQKLEIINQSIKELDNS